ncbi:MAG: hypothetical protein HYZ42_05875 [Bacteroidetes bacterium]|nr:hypothetical protein [Bacteroidota bacterium]
MKKLFYILFFVLAFNTIYAQTDTPCLNQTSYYECLAAKESVWLKTATSAVRKGDSIIVKTAAKKLIFANIYFSEEKGNRDSVRKYIFIKQLKGYVIIERIANFDGNTWFLINLLNGQINKFDALPVFSPSMKRLMVVSGQLHNPFSNEGVYVFKPGKNGWVEEYKSEAKPFEAYGYTKWTSDGRIVAKKYDWEAKTKDGLPLESETVFLFEFNEWRRVSKK